MLYNNTMKRGSVLVLVFVILILSTGLVSASWFGDFWNRITGKFVNNETTTNETTTNETTPTCIESWICADWNSCVIPSMQTRTCVDSNNCGTVINKPIESRPCPTPEDTCTDTDEAENPRTFLKGTTTNNTNSYTDYCINERSLVEYACNDATTTAGPYIYVHTFDCFGYGAGFVCNDGACVQSNSVTCITTDINTDPAVKGTITNSSGSYTDYCVGTTVMQYGCVNSQIYLQEINCVGPYGNGASCVDGACIPGSLPSNSSSGGGGGGGGSSSSENTTPSLSPNVSSEGTGNNISITINSSEKGAVVSQSKFNVDSEESTITGSSGIVATSSIQLSTSEGKAYATKEDGSKQEIKIDPTVAINSVKESIKLETVKEIRMVEYEDKIVYEIDATKSVKIFALIRTDMEIRARVDIEEGNVIGVEKPWWNVISLEI